MRTIEEFAHALVERYTGSFDASDARIIPGALRAGEFEVVAISVIEDVDVSKDDIDELERLAVDFDPVDRDVAARVIAKRRNMDAA